MEEIKKAITSFSRLMDVDLMLQIFLAVAVLLLVFKIWTFARQCRGEVDFLRCMYKTQIEMTEPDISAKDRLNGYVDQLKSIPNKLFLVVYRHVLTKENFRGLADQFSLKECDKYGRSKRTKVFGLIFFVVFILAVCASIVAWGSTEFTEDTDKIMEVATMPIAIFGVWIISTLYLLIYRKTVTRRKRELLGKLSSSADDFFALVDYNRFSNEVRDDVGMAIYLRVKEKILQAGEQERDVTLFALGKKEDKENDNEEEFEAEESEIEYEEKSAEAHESKFSHMNHHEPETYVEAEGEVLVDEASEEDEAQYEIDDYNEDVALIAEKRADLAEEIEELSKEIERGKAEIEKAHAEQLSSVQKQQNDLFQEQLNKIMAEMAAAKQAPISQTPNSQFINPSPMYLAPQMQSVPQNMATNSNSQQVYDLQLQLARLTMEVDARNAREQSRMEFEQMASKLRAEIAAQQAFIKEITSQLAEAKSGLAAKEEKPAPKLTAHDFTKEQIAEIIRESRVQQAAAARAARAAKLKNNNKK